MTEKIQKKQPKRRLEELNLLDDFLFQEMMMQEGDGEKFCRILLKTILGRPIRNVRIVPQKIFAGVDTDKHGIRLDAYVEELPEENGEIDAEVLPDIYDIEPNQTYTKEQKLPKRMRYYHGLIDTKLLDSGADYENLPNVAIIVILPYDPFGKNRMVYTVKNQCVEDAEVNYDDGARKIFLYTKGTEGCPSQELRDMLKYIEESREENVTNRDIAEIHGYVQNVKHSAEIGVNYMKSWERDKMIREEGIEFGRAEGREEGRAEGEKRLAKLTKMLIDAGKMEELKHALADTGYREKLFAENDL